MKNHNEVYIPENSFEEALMLMGRVNALAAYVRSQEYSIPRETIAAILGFDLEERYGTDKNPCFGNYQRGAVGHCPASCKGWICGQHHQGKSGERPEQYVHQL